jgi:hypothetical protein
MSGAPAAAVAAIRALYRRGSGRRRTGPGQPRVVALVTGGGGSLFSWLLSEPGASSCLLEGTVPYAKESLVEFLAEHGRDIEGVGFCSPAMAARMAEAARDRAIQLTPKIEQWPDAIGVASTATIVSHYQRRGGYRVHAAACTGGADTLTAYSHTLTKGARERDGEDAACALLTLRALADAAGLAEAPALAACGVRRDDTPARNAVGEVASGVEELPQAVATPLSAAAAAAYATQTPSTAGLSPLLLACLWSPRAGALTLAYACAPPSQAARAHPAVGARRGGRPATATPRHAATWHPRRTLRPRFDCRLQR